MKKVVLTSAAPPDGTGSGEKPAVMDVHLHATGSPGPIHSTIQTLRSHLALMDSLNVRRAVLTRVSDVFDTWHEEAPNRTIPFLLCPCENGTAANHGRPCVFQGSSHFPEVCRVKDAIESSRSEAFGNTSPQYLGLKPSDPRMPPAEVENTESVFPGLPSGLRRAAL